MEGLYDFDIDVDISSLLGEADLGPILVNESWYRLATPREDRSYLMQAKADQLFKNAMLHAQWQATRRRKLDRRRAVRAPVVSRVHIEGARHMVATNISLTGLRCSGVPRAPLVDIEFKLPGMEFPIDARAEVVSYKESNVIPLVGMRFVGLETPYRDQIAHYIWRRREHDIALAA